MRDNPPEDLFSEPLSADRGNSDRLTGGSQSSDRHPVDRLIGAQIDEYRLETLLGSGGMARVYRAVDVNLDRTVAIKVIDTPYQFDAEYGRRFKREAQAIAQLEHPHIVRLYRYGQAGGLFYMAMQFIRGMNLSDLLKTYRREGQYIHPAEVSRMIRQVGQALDYAHSMGVIHRDVKSSNIMLDQQGQAVLTDFGLALLSSQAVGGDDFGSPHYLAPEQALPNAPVVAQSDLYSLGVILFEMLTGQRPYFAGDPYTLAQKHIHEQPPAPRSIRSAISPAVEAVILKALEKDPQNRFQSGRELSEAFDQALTAQPIGSPPPLTNAADWVQNTVSAVPAPSLWPEAQAPAEDPSPTQTQLSWMEKRRRNPVPAAGIPAGRPAATARRKGWQTPAALAALLFLFLCLGAGALAASRRLPWTGNTAASTEQTATETFSTPGLTRTSQPAGAVRGSQNTQTPRVLIPNTAPTLALPSATRRPTRTRTPSAPTQPQPPAETAVSLPPSATDTLPPPPATETSAPTLPEPTNTLPPPTATDLPPPTATDPPPPTTTVAPPPTEPIPPPVTGPGEINASNQTLTIDCAGGSVTVTGNNNTLTLTGVCGSLTVSGNNNQITVPAGTPVNDSGNKNEITEQ